MRKPLVVRGIPVEAKARLAARIAEMVQRRALTRTQAAEILGLTQTEVSALLKGRFRGISEQRLLECLPPQRP